MDSHVRAGGTDAATKIRRGHLSSADQAELWRRWRQGEPLNAYRPRPRSPALEVVQRVLAGTGGFSPRSPAGAVRGCCPWRSARGCRAAWRSGTACARSPGGSGAPVHSVPRARTARRPHLLPRRDRRCRRLGAGPASAGVSTSPRSPDCGPWSPRSSSRTGRRNRSPAGSATRSRRTSGCTCPMRRSTGACSVPGARVCRSSSCSSTAPLAAYHSSRRGRRHAPGNTAGRS